MATKQVISEDIQNLRDSMFSSLMGWHPDATAKAWHVVALGTLERTGPICNGLLTSLQNIFGDPIEA